jgi:hypothetical protein
LGETYHQGLYLCIDLGASKCLALLGATKLLGHQLAVPGWDSLGRDNAGDLCQCLPSFLPISARVVRSRSLSRTRPLICWRRMRFSVTRYAFRSRSFWSTDLVIYASRRFQSMRLTPSTTIADFASEYGVEPGGNQDEEGREQSCNLCEKGVFEFFDITRYVRSRRRVRRCRGSGRRVSRWPWLS